MEKKIKNIQWISKVNIWILKANKSTTALNARAPYEARSPQKVESILLHAILVARLHTSKIGVRQPYK